MTGDLPADFDAARCGGGATLATAGLAPTSFGIFAVLAADWGETDGADARLSAKRAGTAATAPALGGWAAWGDEAGLPAGRPPALGANATGSTLAVLVDTGLAAAVLADFTGVDATLAGAFLAGLAAPGLSADAGLTVFFAGDLAGALATDLATEGLAGAGAAAGCRVVADLLAVAFTTGLLSDPDDDRISGWRRADPVGFFPAPVAG